MYYNDGSKNLARLAFNDLRTLINAKIKSAQTTMAEEINREIVTLEEELRLAAKAAKEAEVAVNNTLPTIRTEAHATAQQAVRRVSELKNELRRLKDLAAQTAPPNRRARQALSAHSRRHRHPAASRHLQIL